MFNLFRRRQKSWQIAKKHYGNLPSRDDQFYREIKENLGPDSTVLDGGCGYNAETLQHLKGRQLIGIGMEQKFETPPEIHIVRGNLERIPLRSGSIDVATLRMVCEHLEHPKTVFAEVRRVIQDDGKIIFITPSRWYYPSVISSLIPFKFHRAFSELAFGKGAYENFPTFYRMNSLGAFRRVAAWAGLYIERIAPVRDYPSYLMFSPLLFRAGILFEKLVAFLGIRSLHACFLVTLRKDKADT